MAKEAFGMMTPEDDKGAMDEDTDGAMASEDEDDAEGGDEAAQRTALADFLSAIGVKPKKLDAALSAFKELMEHCGSSE